MRPSRIVQKGNGKIIKIAVEDLNGNEYFFQVKEDDYQKWLNGGLIQDCFPYISPEDREIFISGLTPEMWNELFEE